MKPAGAQPTNPTHVIVRCPPPSRPVTSTRPPSRKRTPRRHLPAREGGTRRLDPRPPTLTKYGFPNSPHSCCFQLSPRPGGTLRAASLSSAAALFLWMRTSCSALSGESGGVACSLCSTRAFLAGLACQESGSGVRLRSLAPRGARRLRANLKDRRPKTPMVQPRRGPAMPAYVSTALHAGFSRQNSSRFLPLLIGQYEGRGGHAAHLLALRRPRSVPIGRYLGMAAVDAQGCFEPLRCPSLAEKRGARLSCAGPRRTAVPRCRVLLRASH